MSGHGYVASWNYLHARGRMRTNGTDVRRAVAGQTDVGVSICPCPPERSCTSSGRDRSPVAPRDCTGFTGVGPGNLPYIDFVCRLGLARGVINMTGRYQGFHSLNTGNIEIFWRADGWCWWSRAPGCPSESAPVGPFLTSTDAYLNANGGACLIPRPARVDKVASL